jgi:putative oxidoreductase
MATTASRSEGFLRSNAQRAAALFERAIPNWLLPLLQRFGIASIFFQSGRTKVEGLFTLTDSTFALFQTEYRLPFIDPHTAAYAAAISEHIFPILLVIGLFTRISALALLIMTLVIEIFVYPDAWPTHLSWAALLLPLIATGGGKLSLDHALRLP